MRVISLLLAAACAMWAQADTFVPGLEAFRRGDYAAAEQAFRGSTEARARTFLALTQAATSRCGEAERELDRAFDAASGDLLKLTGLALAQCRITAGKFSEAAAVVTRLRAELGSDADVLYQAARLEMRQWNETIRELYRRAPASFRVNQISGEVLETRGRYAEAAAEFRKAVEKAPQAVGLHYRLGRSLLMTSHTPEVLESALAEFQAELKLNPFDAVAHYQVAQIYGSQGRKAEAAEGYQKASALDAKFVEPLVALGKLRVEERKFDEAIGLLRRAVEIAPSSESAHYNLMLAYRNAGRMDDARREKAELDKLQKTPDGEFADFLKKLK